MRPDPFPRDVPRCDLRLSSVAGGPVAAGYRRAKSDILAIARGNRTCVVDDDAVCPIGWPALGGGLCVAPRRYEVSAKDNIRSALTRAWSCVAGQGACARAYDFSKFSAAAKQAIFLNARAKIILRFAGRVGSRRVVQCKIPTKVSVCKCALRRSRCAGAMAMCQTSGRVGMVAEQRQSSQQWRGRRKREASHGDDKRATYSDDPRAKHSPRV